MEGSQGMEDIIMINQGQIRKLMPDNISPKLNLRQTISSLIKRRILPIEK